MKFFSRVLLTSLTILSTAQAFAIDAEAMSCLLKRPFLFGASITAGYGGLKDGAKARIATSFDGKYFGSNIDPITRLANKYVKNAEITNISEMINVMKFHAFGYLQLQDAIQKPELLKKMAESSVLASVDSFYWPMAFARCETSFANLDWLMGLARHWKKPLILATVPIEKANTIDWIVRQGWTAPDVECTTRFNKYLLENCLPHNDCYVADIAATVVQLNSTGIPFKGKLNKVNDFRFDGVHLTLDGNEWIQGLVSDALAQGNYRCQ